MDLIFHIAHAQEWIEATRVGEYCVSTLRRSLADVGFIHASSATQVEGVANTLFKGSKDLLLLVIDPSRVRASIRYEAAAPGGSELFPHIYGPLNVDAVIEALPFEADSDGRFAFPRDDLDRLDWV
jgi:glutathione S-transferase